MDCNGNLNVRQLYIRYMFVYKCKTICMCLYVGTCFNATPCCNVRQCPTETYA